MNKKIQYCGISGLILFLFGVVTEFLLVYDQGLIVPIHLVAGGILIFWFLLSGGFKVLSSATVRKKAGLGIGIFAYGLIFLCLLIVVNLVVSKNDKLHVDSTEQNVYTLSPQTKDLLDKLETKLEVKGFFLGGQVDKEVSDLLLRFEKYSSNVDWEVIDPEKKPLLVEKYGVSEAGTINISLQGGEKSVKVIRDISEQELVNAVRKLTREGSRKVYYVTGHGEPDLESQSELGYLFLAEAIAGENIELVSIKLADEDIPEDADAVLIAAPEKDYLEIERQRLKKYLNSGGSALVLHDPTLSKELVGLLEPYGLVLGSDVIVDQVVQLFAGPTLGVQPMVTDYGMHSITESFTQGTTYSIASSVQVAESSESVAIPIAFTGANSWGEKNTEDLFGDDPRAALEDEDVEGPVSIAVAYENEQEGSPRRIVVFGDRDFVNNTFIRQLFNRDLFLNALNWSLGEEEGISIRPKTLRASLTTVSNEQFNLLFVLAVIILPELILLGGLAFWLARKD